MCFILVKPSISLLAMASLFTSRSIGTSSLPVRLTKLTRREELVQCNFFRIDLVNTVILG